MGGGICFLQALVNKKNIVLCSLLRRKCKLVTIFPSSVVNMMSHLARFDSEMHEDEDDLEEVAAPIGDQQVSNFSFF